MKKSEFEALKSRPEGEPMLSAALLGDKSRTLAYGYDVDRKTVHIYLSGGEIHALVYSGGVVISHEHGVEMPMRALRPNKRAYPERTDYLFASLMRGAGVSLTFLPFPDGPAPVAFADYYGHIVGDGGVLVDMMALAR